MTILDQLSSRVGDRTQAATLAVAEQCLADPSLIPQIAHGLQDKDCALVADCAEVFTRLAMAQPTLAAPYAEALTPLLAHKTTRARWEAMHTLALIAPVAPEVITPYLPHIERLLRTDKSIIVRDYAVDAIGNYAGTSTQAAETAYPLLKDTLRLWEGRHAARALEGLARVAQQSPSRAFDINGLAQLFLGEKRATVRKAAKLAVKASEAVYMATPVHAARVAWLLACEEPWVRLNTRRDLLGQASDAPEVQAAYADLQLHPAVSALLDDVQVWPQARRMSGAYNPKDSLWKLAILADFGLTRDDERVAAVAEKVLALHAVAPAPPGFLNGGFDHTKSWDHCPYICISHVMTYALARFGYLDDPRLQAAYDYLATWQRQDGGWHPNDATLPGQSRELEPSCPFGTVNGLRALAANPARRELVTAQRSVEFILDCWERRSEPYRPVGFGMGSEFHRLQYPFVQHALLKTVDTLSNFPAALATQRFGQMLNTVATKALLDGRIKPDGINKPYVAFDFGQKKAPSPWLTFLVARAEQRLDQYLSQ